MIDQTWEQLFNKVVTVLEDRLALIPAPLASVVQEFNALRNEGPPDKHRKALHDHGQKLLNATTSAVAPAPRGPCKYKVNGQDFCLEAVTQLECERLGGTPISPVECGGLPRW